MGSPISSAIGTQRQFAKQPEKPYETRLNNPDLGFGIYNQGNANAQALSSALGVLDKGLMRESIEMDRREREQFTAEEAQRMLAGKSSKDLMDLDAVHALQNSGKGFDLADNPYAIATLERTKGQMVAYEARQQWLQDNETVVPKNTQEAVSSFTEYLQDKYAEAKENGVQNAYAFEQGFFDSSLKDSMAVAEVARKKINNAYRDQGQQACRVKYEELTRGASVMSPEDFKEGFKRITNEARLYTTSPQEMRVLVEEALTSLADSDTGTERLNAIKDIEFFGKGRTIGKEVRMYPFYKKIAERMTTQLTDDIYDQVKNPDGTVDWVKAQAVLSSLPKGMVASDGVPPVDLPVASGDIEHLNPELRKALPAVGGLLSSLGITDATITSGYRDAERNAAAGGVPNSRHLTGDAVDIYIGDVDKGTQNQIQQLFKEYFDTVLYHDAGSGKHLHLDGYKGGMRLASSNSERFASAYDPQRLAKTMQALNAKDIEAQRVVRQRERETMEAMANVIASDASFDKKVAAIENSGLPQRIKNGLMANLRSYTGRTEKAIADGDPLTLYYENYRRKGLEKDRQLMASLEFRHRNDTSALEEDSGEKDAEAYQAAKKRIDELADYDRETLKNAARVASGLPPEELPKPKTPAQRKKDEDMWGGLTEEQYRDVVEVHKKLVADGMPIQEADDYIFNKLAKDEKGKKLTKTPAAIINTMYYKGDLKDPDRNLLHRNWR